jgi:hypothetical protein
MLIFVRWRDICAPVGLTPTQTPQFWRHHGANMKSFLRLAVVSAILLGAAAIPARAESGATLSYTLTGPVSATWTMSQDPTTLFPTDGIVFVVDVPDLVVGGAATPDMIVFFSLGDMGGVTALPTRSRT